MTNKEAIAVLKNHISPYDNCKADNEANQAIRLAIEALEKRLKGEWIIDEEWITPTDNPSDDYEATTYTCPFCGRVEYTNFDYCRCGADMRFAEG